MDRLEKIAVLMKEITRKMEAISLHNKCLREFNFKVEALLAAFEAYSAPGSCEEPVPIQCSTDPVDVAKKRKVPEQEMVPEPVVHAEESLAAFLGRMATHLPENKLLRSNAAKIASCLYLNREGMVLEGVMRGTGVSKYRCIDILNTLLKTDPPLLSKRFDKGFIYSAALL